MAGLANRCANVTEMRHCFLQITERLFDWLFRNHLELSVNIGGQKSLKNRLSTGFNFPPLLILHSTLMSHTLCGLEIMTR